MDAFGCIFVKKARKTSSIACVSCLWIIPESEDTGTDIYNC